jgi:hypothetical protein
VDQSHSHVTRPTTFTGLRVHPAYANAPQSLESERALTVEGAWILVAWGGIEPPTRGFSIRCSTN